MAEVLTLSAIPLGALLGSAAYTFMIAYRLQDWRPVLFGGVLALMALHQANEIFVASRRGAEAALSGFGEYPETLANLLASVAAVVMLRFVMRERELSQKLQDLTDELEERVQERTAELKSFAYSVSHDLRAPLRAIDGYTQILNEDHADQLNDEGRRLLRVVRESTHKMETLIDDLLTLSRTGRREMEQSPLKMEEIVRTAYEEVSQTRPAAEDATLVVQSLPSAVGDPSMIHHVMSNLLSNAVKFSREEATPRIVVGGEKRRDQAVFYVRDNGVGFDMDFSEKLFGVFDRLHDEEEFEGTGVGLAIVKRIIDRHGGRVWAESTEGEGASFYFSLPQRSAHNHSAQNVA